MNWLFEQVIPRATAYGRDVLAGLSAGAIGHVLAGVTNAQNPNLGLQPPTVALATFLIALTVLSFSLASRKQFEEELKGLQKLRDSGCISEELCARLQARVVMWYAARRFGGALPPYQSQHPPREPEAKETTPKPSPSPKESTSSPTKSGKSLGSGSS